MRKMTLQTAYNRVKKKLLKQNKKSGNRAFSCAYRGKNGLRCGIGWLIPNRLYNKDMEGIPVRCDRILSILNLIINTSKCEEKSIRLFRAIQTTHDNYSTEIWKESLERAATDADLTP